MTHLDEEQVVSLCFGDGTAADVAHAASCADCAAAVLTVLAMSLTACALSSLIALRIDPARALRE